jgi:hypothetical protein
MTRNRSGAVPLVVAGLLSIATATLTDLALERFDIGSVPLRMMIALLPVPFFALFIVAEFRWIRGQDEFHRKVFLHSLAIAFPLVIAEAVTVDALQSAGFLTGITVGDLWPYMALSWFPALVGASWRYR